MPSILREFANGRLVPEVDVSKKSLRYRRTVELMASIEKRLLARLGPEEKDLFEKFVCAQEEAGQIVEAHNFIQGYKMGLVMTAEAFTGIEDLYVEVEEL